MELKLVCVCVLFRESCRTISTILVVHYLWLQYSSTPVIETARIFYSTLLSKRLLNDSLTFYPMFGWFWHLLEPRFELKQQVLLLQYLGVPPCMLVLLKIASVLMKRVKSRQTCFTKTFCSTRFLIINEWQETHFSHCTTPFACQNLAGKNILLPWDLLGQMAQCIMNSYHSGCCVCGKLLKGHEFNTQQSQSLQIKPSSHHAAAGKAQWHHVKAAQVFEASAHTEHTTSTVTSNGRFLLTHNSTDSRNTWSRQLLCCSDCRTRKNCGVLWLRMSRVDAHDSHSMLNQCNSSTRNCTETQCDLLTPPLTHCACPNSTIANPLTITQHSWITGKRDWGVSSQSE